MSLIESETRFPGAPVAPPPFTVFQGMPVIPVVVTDELIMALGLCAEWLAVSRSISTQEHRVQIEALQLQAILARRGVRS